VTITLITGGNKGLGREAARRLIGLSHTVYLGARDRGRRRAAAGELGARFLPLDVTDDSSVTGAAGTITRRERRLDVLINNAGMFEGLLKPEEITPADAERIYAVSVTGIVRTTQAFMPLLRASASPVIVNVSSGLGPFGVVTDPASRKSAFSVPVYGSSKAAVGMLTVQYAKGLPDLRVNAADPGFTATDLNGNTGHQNVGEGTDAIARLATIGPDGPTGTFLSRTGPVPW
jgi:NAD(P)-dependent dehydrogenase (short-subunit alcohol dehydrogenase family)